MTQQDQREGEVDMSTSGSDRAREAASTGKDQAREVASTASEQARKVASTAQDEARDVVRGANQQARRLVGDTRQELRTQQIAERLRQGGIDDVIGQLRNAGRNRPGLFLLGAFGTGLVAGRVVRNLAQEQGGGNGSSGESTVGAGSAPSRWAETRDEEPTAALAGQATSRPPVDETSPPAPMAPVADETRGR